MLQAFDKFDAWAMDSLKVFGLAEDILKLVIYFFACVPLGILFSRIGSPTIKMIYNIIFGVFFTLFLGRDWFVYINITTLVCYLVTQLPQKQILIPTFITAFSALAYIHIHRLMYDYSSWKIDFSVLQMTATCRLIYYAADLQDSLVNDRSFLLYYSYIFMFPCIMIGPVPFKSYYDLIYKKNDYVDVKYSNRKVLIEFSKALLLSAGEIYIRPYFDFSWYNSPEWKQLNLFQKNILQAIIGMTNRFRYFAGFKYTQASMNAIGITYNPETQDFDKYMTCDYTYELEKNAIQKTVKWNSNVQVWLKYCFFDRFQKLFSISTSYYLTYLISAVWHGFYFGYYQTFFWWALINQNCKYAYRARSKFDWIPPKIRTIGAWVYCTFTMNIIVMTMGLIDWQKGLQFNNDMYWSGQIATLTVFFFFYYTGYGQKK